mmetsp:Transcript_32653/g.86733  ORF Transcript_32653/g.86733 Transcript_32653/m.86733 type:complete len:82 (+) Transcript_32653:145-390(+)
MVFEGLVFELDVLGGLLGVEDDESDSSDLSNRDFFDLLDAAASECAGDPQGASVVSEDLRFARVHGFGLEDEFGASDFDKS